MKQRLVPIALIIMVSVAILNGCTAGKHKAPPTLTPLSLNRDATICSTVFPRGNWQFVHSLEFTRADGRGTTVIGVTSLSENVVHTALLTVEGLTLFEADFLDDGSFQVHRAVPPFDKPHFATGMMRDIRTIFRPPENIPKIGQTAAQQTLCRYRDNDGRITDVLPVYDEYQGDCWQIRRYSAEQDLNLTVVGKSCLETMSAVIPEYLELQSYGIVGYTLNMKLLSADRL